MPKNYHTASKTAQALNMSACALYRLEKEGAVIPTMWVNGKGLYTDEDIEKLKAWRQDQYAKRGRGEIRKFEPIVL